MERRSRQQPRLLPTESEPLSEKGPQATFSHGLVFKPSQDVRDIVADLRHRIAALEDEDGGQVERRDLRSEAQELRLAQLKLGNRIVGEGVDAQGNNQRIRL